MQRISVQANKHAEYNPSGWLMLCELLIILW